jgi:hypothetical protein
MTKVVRPNRNTGTTVEITEVINILERIHRKAKKQYRTITITRSVVVIVIIGIIIVRKG